MTRTNKEEYDFNTLEYISTIEGDFIPIEDIEPDPFMRIYKYPHITMQKKIEMKYKNTTNHKIITKTLLHNKKCGKKRILDRRNWIKFGKASDHNNGITTLADTILFEFENEHGMKVVKEDEKAKPTSGFKISHFKPSLKHIERVNQLEKNTTTRGYIPSSIKHKLKENEDIENISICIKNIPAGEDVFEMQDLLRGMFSSYGEIKYIKVLKDKHNGQSRDIGFIEFYYGTDALTLLDSSERFIIDSCILCLIKSTK